MFLVTFVVLFSYTFQGLVNLEAEVAKCNKKIDLVRLNLDKLYKLLSQSNYQTTVPEAVQLGNEEKVWHMFYFCLVDFKLIVNDCV